MKHNLAEQSREHVRHCDALDIPAVEQCSIGLAAHSGGVSDAVRIPAGHDLIVLPGTSGLVPADGFVSESTREQCAQAWRNVEIALRAADADLSDIVLIRTWLTNADDIPTYNAVQAQTITHQPAATLIVVDRLMRSECCVLVEVVAATPHR
jgi:2-iminobutanoate/2-iminopropanoate deaminase